MTELPKRKPNRLAGYDYSKNGAYFVTICVKGRHEILCAIATDECNETRTAIVGANCVRPQLTDIGKIVDSEIKQLSKTYTGVSVDCFVVMPNHIHMIILILDETGQIQFAPTVSRIIKQWKGSVTKKIGYSIWQKSFHDHIIRNEEDYYQISEYINNNPVNWKEDCFYNEVKT